MKTITKERLEKYFDVTGRAIIMCKAALNQKDIRNAKDFLDMAERYYSDAKYFYKKDDYVNAYGAINYAHGWLDAGARIGLFLVKDSKLFTVDD